ncbi:hypothetical protein WJX81_004328 [Elliptochloris bilobata]|uniref:60S ribosomal protein L34 n=1 Tax=Elliptochloris bilobata TaxID=381761 RepID=A0AAW1SJK5_9CHLO
MVQRVTYRRRHCYATKSNKTRKVKTPGGKLVVHYTRKPASHRICGATGVRLNGIPALRPKEMSNKRLSRRHKTVHRIYGGHLDHKVVRERIIRAFLIEEQKIVKKVLKLQKAKEKAPAK